MKKKIKKPIQKIETSKISETFIKEKDDSLDYLKINILSSVEEDKLSEIKKNMVEEIFDDISIINNDILYNSIFKERDIVLETSKFSNIEDENKQDIIYSDDFITIKDEINENNLIREIIKINGDKLIINIIMNNPKFEEYKEITLKPFDVYYKEEKIFEYSSFNFVLNILKNVLNINYKNYPLFDVRFVNLKN